MLAFKVFFMGLQQANGLAEQVPVAWCGLVVVGPRRLVQSMRLSKALIKNTPKKEANG